MHEFAIRLRVIPSSKTKLPSSIFDKLPRSSLAKGQDFKPPSHAGAKDPRSGPINIDWVDMESNEKGKDKEKGGTGHGKGMPSSAHSTKHP
jgi:hypothetical protein